MLVLPVINPPSRQRSARAPDLSGEGRVAQQRVEREHVDDVPGPAHDEEAEHLAGQQTSHHASTVVGRG